MTRTERRKISLTGPDSHLLVREPGVGSLVVGPAGRQADLHVDPDAAIDWSAVNGLPGIETSERDDVATAVTLLAALSAVPVGRPQALAWFEATRDF